MIHGAREASFYCQLGNHLANDGAPAAVEALVDGRAIYPGLGLGRVVEVRDGETARQRMQSARTESTQSCGHCGDIYCALIVSDVSRRQARSLCRCRCVNSDVCELIGTIDEDSIYTHFYVVACDEAIEDQCISTLLRSAETDVWRNKRVRTYLPIFFAAFLLTRFMVMAFGSITQQCCQIDVCISESVPEPVPIDQ